MLSVGVRSTNLVKPGIIAISEVGWILINSVTGATMSIKCYCNESGDFLEQMFSHGAGFPPQFLKM